MVPDTLSGPGLRDDGSQVNLYGRAVLGRAETGDGALEGATDSSSDMDVGENVTR